MKICKYCSRKVQQLHFQCCMCEEYVDLKCCRQKTPGNLAGDVFFVFTCADCNNSDEKFERSKMGWVDIMLLVIYHLTLNQYEKSLGNNYFHRDRHIKKLLNEKWRYLFPHMKSKRKSWRQMMAETLKKNSEYFTAYSESKNNKEEVWYRLAKSDLLPNQALIDRETRKGFGVKVAPKRKREEVSETETSTGYDSSSQDGISSDVMSQLIAPQDNDMYSRFYVKPGVNLSQFLFADEEELGSTVVEDDVDIEGVEKLSSENIITHNAQPSIFEGYNGQESQKMEVESDSTISVEESCDGNFSENEEPNHKAQTLAKELPRKCSLLKSNPNADLLPWISDNAASCSMHESRCTPMNKLEEAYELAKLKKRIENAELLSVGEIRLNRKLAVRQLKREHRMNVFNMELYNRSGGLVPNYDDETTGMISTAPRVLDRFQSPKSFTTTSSVPSRDSFISRLMGETEQYTCFTSPLTQRVLKAYIRQDFETRPLWLRLCSEIRDRGGGGDRTCDEPRCPIIYSYVRPHHLPAVNSLAEQYFWPGINLAECLHFPDYSCVVLYKKLVVAFAFLVPDVDHNQAYISFILTRPEWRGAGIGTFMLYHLIQTCIGKDITLHVSATNPALILYQKFGFKVEQFIQDFYDKYLPAESNECRHALFLRLSRNTS